VALLEAFKQQRLQPSLPFDLSAQLGSLFALREISDWISLFGITLFGAVIALATAATAVARSKK